MKAQHVVNISGGKDSTAVYLLALRRGRPFRALMADTGHEHPATIEYAERLSERTGGPAVEMVRADFSAEIARKRHYVETAWRADGVPEPTIERALAALVPTGIPMLDLCLWKGRLEPNPLYRQGMSRVGCFPCINASKGELAAIGRRFPWAVDRLMEYEAAVAAATKRGIATFFAPDKTPEGAALAKRMNRRALANTRRELPDADPNGREFERARARRMSELSENAPWPRADTVFKWARTERGGRQFGFESWIADQDADDGLSCSSQYGLCE